MFEILRIKWLETFELLRHIHVIHAIRDNDVWNTKVLLYYNNLENNTIFKEVFWVHNINDVMGHLFGWLQQVVSTLYVTEEKTEERIWFNYLHTCIRLIGDLAFLHANQFFLQDTLFLVKASFYSHALKNV